jgi:hypothetical protein
MLLSVNTALISIFLLLWNTCSEFCALRRLYVNSYPEAKEETIINQLHRAESLQLL